MSESSQRQSHNSKGVSPQFPANKSAALARDATASARARAGGSRAESEHFSGEKRAQPLGINTGTAAALQPRGFQPSEQSQKIEKTPQQSRAERYALKSVVNQIFPRERVAKCCRCRRSQDPVTIHKSKEHSRAFYGGLVVCGSPWGCPLCAAKIAERKRAELVQASMCAEMMGLSVYLATFTVPHGLGDDVNVILDHMTAAWRSMTMSRGYKDFHKELHIVGTIRALETTYGQNGFHPHYHVMIFTKTHYLPDSIGIMLGCLWRQACVRKGLPEPSRERGVRVDNGTWAARYASKWGIEDEMTKSHLKTSKGLKGMSPWDMLRDVLSTGNEESRRLFAVYYRAFKGRRQLYWSNGLRQYLGLNQEVSDEELAAQQDDDAFELARLTTEQWRGILFSKAESAVLDLAETDPASLQSFLDQLAAISQHAVVPEALPPNPKLHKYFKSRGVKK